MEIIFFYFPVLSKKIRDFFVKHKPFGDQMIKVTRVTLATLGHLSKEERKQPLWKELVWVNTPVVLYWEANWNLNGKCSASLLLAVSYGLELLMDIFQHIADLLSNLSQNMKHGRNFGPAEKLHSRFAMKISNESSMK